MKNSRFITKIFPFVFKNQNLEDIDNATLRERIKKKYMLFTIQDMDTFPKFDYNTNRKNYEPLKKSFEDEFYNRRRIDRLKNNLHIPSTNTFASFFTDENYVPSQKILNTFLSYTEKSIKPNHNPDEKPNSFTLFPLNSMKRRILFSILLIVGSVFFINFSYKWFIHRNDRLQILNPETNTTLPRISVIEGIATNAKEVFTVVRPKYGKKFYVQRPAIVKENGKWGEMLVLGRNDNEDVGYIFEIRAFINPSVKIKDDDILSSWPKAEVSTEVIEVTRK